MPKFTDRDVDRVGALSVQIKTVLVALGIPSAGPDGIAALKLLTRLAEQVHAMTPEQKKESLLRAIVGLEDMDLKAELRFILEDMERDGIFVAK